MTEPTLNAADFQAPPQIDTMQKVGLGVGLVGLIGLAVGFAGDHAQFYKSYLLAYVFVLGIPVGSLTLLMIHHLSGGRWSLALRRTFEASARTIPLMAVLFLPVILGMHDLYEWTHADVVARDPILLHKAPYLNQSGFILRAVGYFAIWSFLAMMLSRWSAQQDREDFPLARFNKISGPGVLIVSLTVTFASVDWVMSLDPHWFSTIFGLWFLMGMALTALAFSIVVAALLHNNGHVAKALSADRFHDYGTLLYAFIMLWAYLAYSQFLIVWSANLPEEIPYYLRRFGDGWQGVTLVLVAGHFVLPWLLLLFRSTKRITRRLVTVACLMLVMRFLDVFWLIAPWVKQGAFGVHWMDIAAVLAVLGLWVGAFCYLLKGRAVLPVGDPYLPEALADGHDPHHPRASHGDDGAGPLNHEPTDISLDGIGKLTIGFVVILLVVSTAMLGTYRLLDRRARAADAPASKLDKGYGRVDIAGAPLMNGPNALEAGGRLPAGPKMLTNEPLWLRDVRAQQVAAVTTYGWVNKETGIVRVPIERAKELILQAGLPVTTAPAAPAAATEPAAAAPAPATAPASH